MLRQPVFHKLALNTGRRRTDPDHLLPPRGRHSCECRSGGVHQRPELGMLEALGHGARLLEEKDIRLRENVSIDMGRILDIENETLSAMQGEVYKIANGTALC